MGNEMTGLRVLTRRPSARMAEAELTHFERRPIDIALAERQHDAYRAALARLGAVGIDLPPLDRHPDCAFVEDTLIALPEIFVLCRPGAASRLGEVESVAAALPADRPVARIAGPATIDGGDVLWMSRTLFVGRSARTNDAGIAALGALIGPFGYRVEPVAVGAVLHLKTAVTALGPDRVLINPELLDPTPFSGLHPVTAAEGELLAGNCLSIGGRVFMQPVHPKTAERVAKAGYSVDLLDISEFTKAEAALTCLSVVVPA
jgi:dimethylargininase